MGNKRLHFIDIVKGILITLLMFGHFSTNFYGLGLKSSALGTITSWHDWFLVFYMQGFFLVTGYCTNFTKSFKPYLLSNIKTLVIPALLFTFICRLILGVTDGLCFENLINYIFGTLGYWFLWALFIGKMLYWVIQKSAYSGCIVLCLFLLAAFCSLSTSIPNYFFWENSLLCSFFLYVGDKLRRMESITEYRYLYDISLFTFIILMSILFAYNLPRPSVTAAILFGSWKEVPLHLCLALLGSIACFRFALFIGKNKLLELIGRNTLIIYGVHVFIMILLEKIVKLYFPYDLNNFVVIVSLYIFISLFTLFMSLGFSILFNKYKCFKFLTGKW